MHTGPRNGELLHAANALTHARALTRTHTGLQDQNTHWYLACINFIEKRTEVYDSMGAKNQKVIAHVCKHACWRMHRLVRIGVSLHASTCQQTQPLCSSVWGRRH